MSEVAAKRTFREAFQKQFPFADWQRIEDGMQAGIPDANLCIEGEEIWIEFKQMDAFPVRASTVIKVGLSREQLLWLNRRTKAGGQTRVVAKIKDEWFFFNDHYTMLFNGMTRVELLKMSMWHGKQLDVTQLFRF